jgi:hypothetical protein
MAATSGEETCVCKGASIARGTGGRENWTGCGHGSTHNLETYHATNTALLEGLDHLPRTWDAMAALFMVDCPAWLYFENTNILIILRTTLGPEHKLVCGRTPLFLHTAKNVQGKHTHGDQILARKLENGRQIKCNQTWDKNIDLTQVFWSDCKSKLSSKMQSEHRFVH